MVLDFLCPIFCWSSCLCLIIDFVVSFVVGSIVCVIGLAVSHWRIQTSVATVFSGNVRVCIAVSS